MQEPTYIAGYGHRYSDPLGHFVSHDEDKLRDAIDQAMRYDQEEHTSLCENEDHAAGDDEPCEDCEVDLVWWGVDRVTNVANYFGTFSYALEVMRELRTRDVVALETY